MWEYHSAVQRSLSYRLTLYARLMRQYSRIAVPSMSLPLIYSYHSSIWYDLIIVYLLDNSNPKIRYDVKEKM